MAIFDWELGRNLAPREGQKITSKAFTYTLKVDNYGKYGKTGLKRQLKKKAKNCFFKTHYGLMQVKSIAECSKGEHSANTLYLH